MYDRKLLEMEMVSTVQKISVNGLPLCLCLFCNKKGGGDKATKWGML